MQEAVMRILWGSAATVLVLLPQAWAQDSAALPEAPTKCVYSEQALANERPVKSDTLTLLGTDPPAGADVRKDTVIGVDVQFHIRNFRPDAFFVLPQFPTLSATTMSPGNPGDDPALHAASGQVHLCVRLEEPYESVNLKWPMTMLLGLYEETGERSGRMLANTESIGFHGLDIPAESLAWQASAPPEGYLKALREVFNYIEQQGAVYQTCITVLPDVQAKFTPIYHAWESRNATVIAQVEEQQIEQFRIEMKGNMQYAMYMYDMLGKSISAEYAKFPEQQLRAQCSYIQRALSDSDGDPKNAVRDELATVLAYLAKQAKTKSAP
jgi:hypothetical protein